jgi:hypothetical protein
MIKSCLSCNGNIYKAQIVNEAKKITSGRVIENCDCKSLTFLRQELGLSDDYTKIEKLRYVEEQSLKQLIVNFRYDSNTDSEPKIEIVCDGITTVDYHKELNGFISALKNSGKNKESGEFSLQLYVKGKPVEYIRTQKS